MKRLMKLFATKLPQSTVLLKRVRQSALVVGAVAVAGDGQAGLDLPQAGVGAATRGSAGTARTGRGRPLDAKIVVGAVPPASPDPIPIVLLPGFECRMRVAAPGDPRDPLAPGGEKVRPARRSRRLALSSTARGSTTNHLGPLRMRRRRRPPLGAVRYSRHPHWSGPDLAVRATWCRPKQAAVPDLVPAGLQSAACGIPQRLPVGHARGSPATAPAAPGCSAVRGSVNDARGPHSAEWGSNLVPASEVVLRREVHVQRHGANVISR
jgi:hypothetical protein